MASYKQMLVECALLASTDLSEVSRTLDIPETELGLFIEKFPVCRGTQLEKLEYVLGLPSGDDRTYKLWAVTQGLRFVKWKLGKEAPLDPVQGLQELFTDCVLKSKECLFSGNSTDSSKESTKWVKLSLDIARLLKVWTLDSEAAMKDLEMALEQADITSLKSLGDLEQ